MADQACPPLPDGSVDFTSFHDAIAKSKGKVDLTEALDAAVIRPEPDPAPAEEPAPSPAPAPVAAPATKA